MPLEKGKGKAAFSNNVAEMVKAGHPRDQALAAAYRMKGEKPKVGVKAKAEGKVGVKKG